MGCILKQARTQRLRIRGADLVVLYRDALPQLAHAVVHVGEHQLGAAERRSARALQHGCRRFHTWLGTLRGELENEVHSEPSVQLISELQRQHLRVSNSGQNDIIVVEAEPTKTQKFIFPYKLSKEWKTGGGSSHLHDSELAHYDFHVDVLKNQKKNITIPDVTPIIALWNFVLHSCVAVDLGRIRFYLS